MATMAQAYQYGGSYATGGQNGQIGRPSGAAGGGSDYGSNEGGSYQQQQQSQYQQSSQQQRQRSYSQSRSQSPSNSQRSNSQQQQYHDRDREQAHGQASQTSHTSHTSSQHQQHLSHQQVVSVMEDSDSGSSGSEDEFESDPQLAMAMDPEQQHFYVQQQQQARYYQQHQQASGGVAPEGGYQARLMGEKERERRGSASASASAASSAGDGDANGTVGGAEEDDAYSDDGSSVASIPDEEIDFGLTYALHTFLATVEGQASVVKGDSLLLLDDANSYWWLVRVLKTEDVGYIPAENIETPYERLARLNKHRNVDLAAATANEKALAEAAGRDKARAGFAGFGGSKGPTGSGKSVRRNGSGSSADGGERRVVFAPPTYVDHPGKTWSSDEEDTSDEEDDVEQSLEESGEGQEDSRAESDGPGMSDGGMEPDDGVEWADDATRQVQASQIAQRPNQVQNGQGHGASAAASSTQVKSNNPFAQQRAEAPATRPTEQQQQQETRQQWQDPAQDGETRRITATPAVAQGGVGGAQNGLLPSVNLTSNNPRNVSNQSVLSIVSTNSSGSLRETAAASNVTDSPEGGKRLSKMRRSGSQESLGSDKGEKKKRGMLGGLFSRKSKDKKGISSADPRASEDSFGGGTSGQHEQAAVSPSRAPQESNQGSVSGRAPTPADRRQGDVTASPPGAPSQHSLRLQQNDQQRMQAYTSKYLSNGSPNSVRAPTASEAAAAVAQSAAAMRLAASMNGVTNNRPSSIIISPNPAAPLLNVMRVFAGDHVKSEASFKTVLINESTNATDLIRQAMQRFRLRDANQPGAEAGYFLTVRDVIGEEMELESDERPLSVFLDAVQRWSEENGGAGRNGATTPTVKRSSVGSISSVMSLSTHPAIAKLGMNDFSDDSAVKIYLHRKRPGSMVFGANGMGDFSSYGSQLSTVHEQGDSPSKERPSSGQWSTDASPEAQAKTVEQTPSHLQPRYNPSLTVTTGAPPSPERFSSPSARFTIQLLIHPRDLPEESVFDPTTDAIISKQVLRDRLAAGHPSHSREVSQDVRRRLFMLPRNATVVEAIEQGLERFGIYDGVVDGGDDVQERGGKGRNSMRIPYGLYVVVHGSEQHMSPSSKLLDAYTSPPAFKPMERSTPEQKRRSREWSYNSGNTTDILPTDPVFVLRRSGRPNELSRIDAPKGVIQQQQALAATAPRVEINDARNALSPQEIIAAQRAASRANQRAIISAQTNQSQGIDVVLPDRGTLRSSRLLEPTGGEVVRYSYIDDDGETYDISELLEEEWGSEEIIDSPAPGYLDVTGPWSGKPGLERHATDKSEYVTAPSTPLGLAPPDSDRPRSSIDSRRGSVDILAGVVEKSAGKSEGKLEEKLARVIDKVKSKVGGAANKTRRGSDVDTTPRKDRSAPTAIASTRPMSRNVSAMLAERDAQAASGYNHGGHSPAGSNSSRSASRLAQADYVNTAASVNKIISRHRQQPSIASIMSDLSPSVAHDDAASVSTVTRDRHEDDTINASNYRDRASTPATATSSTHPTPPLGSAIYLRAVNSASPTMRAPVKYTDDFGMRTLIGLIEARAREMRPKRSTGAGSSRQRRMSSAASVSSAASSRRSIIASHDPYPSGKAQEEEEMSEDVTRMFWGARLDKDEVEMMHPDIRAGYGGVMARLDAWDLEVDELLGSLAGMMGVRVGEELGSDAGEGRDRERDRDSVRRSIST